MEKEQVYTHYFVPLSVETSGVCGPEALSLFHDIASRIRSVVLRTDCLALCESNLTEDAIFP